MTVWVSTKIRKSAAAMILLMASSLVAAAAASPARAAASTCTVDFRVSTWTVDADDKPNVDVDGEGNVVWTGEPTVGIGFLGSFTVTNTGDALNPWKAAFETPPATRAVGNGLFSAKLLKRTALPQHTLWVVSPLGWNANLPTGGTVTFYLQGVVPDPTITRSQLLTTFALPGRTCTNVS